MPGARPGHITTGITRERSRSAQRNTMGEFSMIKLIVLLVTSLLVLESTAQATAARHIVKRHNYMNANAWLVPSYTSPGISHRSRVPVSGQDNDQPPHVSLQPYLEGSCWDLGTCD